MLNIAVCMLLIIITLAGFTKVYKIANISLLHLETCYDTPLSGGILVLSATLSIVLPM